MLKAGQKILPSVAPKLGATAAAILTNSASQTAPETRPTNSRPEVAPGALGRSRLPQSSASAMAGRPQGAGLAALQSINNRPTGPSMSFGASGSPSRPISTVSYPTSLKADEKTVRCPGHVQLQPSKREVNSMVKILNQSSDNLPAELKKHSPEDRAELKALLKEGAVALGGMAQPGAKPIDSKLDQGHFPSGAEYKFTADLKPLRHPAADDKIPTNNPRINKKRSIESHDHGELSKPQLTNLMEKTLDLAKSAESADLNYSITGSQGVHGKDSINCVDVHHVLSVAAGLLPKDSPAPPVGTRPQDAQAQASKP